MYGSIKDGKLGDDGKISEGHINIKNYSTFEKTWDTFELKNMVDYHDHYLRKDVLLLADVFKKFIDTCLKYYGFDTSHYFNSHGLSWDAMLKMTDKKLEKISDIDKYLFIEKETRGEVSYIAKTYVKAIMTLINHQHLLLIWIKIFCTVGKWVNIFLMENLND